MPTQPTQSRDNNVGFGVGAAVGSRPPRPRTPPEKPDNLKKALADHNEDKHGTKTLLVPSATSLLQTLMNARTPGQNKVLNKKFAFSLPFFTVTTWPPSKFSSTLAAKVSWMPMPVTLSPKLPTSTCLTLTAVTLAATQTVTDVLHGSLHRPLYLEVCATGGLSLSLFSLFFSSSLFCAGSTSFRYQMVFAIY